jgi:class 3 adenylate cyclase
MGIGGPPNGDSSAAALAKISKKSDSESCTDGGRYNTAAESGRDDSPEALVRHETKVIRYLRNFAVLILVSASLIMAGSIFAFIRRAQQDNLEAEFAFIAESIAGGLLEDSARYVNFGEAMVAALETTMTVTEQDHTTFSIPSHLYSNMARPAILGTRSRYLSWNPLLRSDAERHTFEAMVTKKEEEGFFDGFDKPRCYMCGSEDAKPTSPDVQVETGAGIVTCGNLDLSGRLGLIPMEVCQAVVADYYEICGCARSNASTNPRSKRKPSAGLFRDGNSSSYATVDEPWNGGPYLPMWQDRFAYDIGEPLLYNQLSHPKLASAASKMIFTGAWEVSEFLDEADNSFYRSDRLDDIEGPISLWYFPVRNSNASDIVGAVSIFVNWNSFATRKMPRNGHLVDIVLEAACGDHHSTAHTYNVDPAGTLWAWVGAGDLHDPVHGRLKHQTTFEDFDLLRRAATNTITAPDSCRYRFSVHSTKALRSRYLTNAPWMYAGASIVICLFTSCVFGVYDRMVRRRQIKIMKSATQTDDLVASLFPHNVRGRLFQQDQDGSTQVGTDGLTSTSPSQVARRPLYGGTNPIADLFPSCTVIFIDIANFTPWCSEREPSQVFVLLETLYSAFDTIAQHVGVFKVETIGDSYVAVAGLPTPCRDHASVMAMFGHLCLLKMNELVKELEVTLGPSTGDLRARCGLHSGPVTAGVLRGTKARFQLFGDTVNTASRLQSAGAPNRIHTSQQTAMILASSDKSEWVAPRNDRVRLKGKGSLQTYWLNPPFEDNDSIIVFHASADTCASGDMTNSFMEAIHRRERLIKWNVQTLYGLLETLSRYRSVIKTASTSSAGNINRSATVKDKDGEGLIVIDEMTEIIVLPPFDPQIHTVDGITTPGLASAVKDQLHVYVSDIASLYRDVPFHNFEHASHVIMSATKLMSRIVSPEGVDQSASREKDKRQRKVAIARKIHEMTYGLSSDALMQFSVVFSALIHDVDHTGLSNQELVSSNAAVAEKYRNKCVAEQNSVDIAWDLLMQDRFTDLRDAICPTNEELNRFRELIVDAVLATDIADNELGTLRKHRWKDAFSRSDTGSSEQVLELDEIVDMDRKATIVFEHIIQASDVSHTMQHWHTYQKYNARLFEERYVAFRRGVAGEKPPWHGWYSGELWFFDNYIIPLAQKLHDCGVFGVSYDEFINYAQENRSEWARKGEEIVQGWLVEVERKYETFRFDEDT